MRKKIAYLIFLSLCLILCGCVQESRPQATANSPSSYSVTDHTGTVLKLQKKPERIVSINIAADEILMGLVQPERIAALSYLSEEPGISHITGEAKQVPVKIRAQVESVVAVQPDLVLVPDWLPTELPLALRDSGLVVYVFQTANSMDDVRRNIREIAQVLGEVNRGEILVAKMDDELKSIAAKLSNLSEAERVTVARVSTMGGSGGVGTSFDDICRHAHVRNAGAMAGLDKTGSLTQEQLIQIDPDVFLLPTWDYTNKADLVKLRAEIQNDPALKTVKAVRTGRLVQVLDRDLFCTSQYIVQGVRGVAKAAYPNLFVE